MFCPVTGKERRDFFSQNVNSFIPGYTGHCPTLRFHYGKCYGTRTREIMQELREKGMLRSGKTEIYRHGDYHSAVLKPIPDAKGQTKDYAMEPRCKFPRYISGYTGFVPTMNFRYGKSYSRAADDSMCEFAARQRKLERKQRESWEAARAKSAPKLTPIRGRDEVDRMLRNYEGEHGFKERQISPEAPPIAGYTGHIPRVRSNEESLSQRYDTVVRRGLKMLREERESRRADRNVRDRITDILSEEERKYGSYRDV